MSIETAQCLGGADLSWQGDYGQFYLIDQGDTAFLPPVDPALMGPQRLVVQPAGLVVYTGGCLQQIIRIAIYDTEPDHEPGEWRSDRPWDKVQTVDLRFPSQAFTISSPSHPSPQPYGPLFLLGAEQVKARVAWMEFPDGRDDSVPIEPDVFSITIWWDKSS